MPQEDKLAENLDTCQVKVIHLDRLQEARRVSPPASDLERLSQVYKVLGDPGRLGMLTALLGGEMCVCDLAALAGLSDSATSHHLRRLRDLGLARPRREGQILYYSLADDHVRQLLQLSLEHLGCGEEEA
ncbi:MAG: metalloregulator ArsR/SmtB family transcription factor [Deltaproteobacteria bacterium]|nr:metalloregulator ArsR/SmtB family transcription factor [Deltaproteobacteria bacterium]